MEEDVAKALAYQVKREIAERYFGFRRLIEKDTQNYQKAVEKTRQKLQKEIAPAFWRLYALVPDQDLRQKLANLLGLGSLPFEKDFQDLSQEEQKRLFRGLKPKGLTRKGRFKHLFWDVYQHLWDKVQGYQETLQELGVEAEVINEEVKRFKQKFDLSEIMQFLKSFEVSEDASLGHPDFKESVTGLEKRLELGRVSPPEELLPAFEGLPKPEELHRPLEALANEVWKRHKSWAKELVELAHSEE